MVLTNLGTQTISISPTWTSFTAFTAKAGEGYCPEFLIGSTNSALIYSAFTIRYQYPSLNSTTSISIPIVNIYYDPLWQIVPISVPSILATTGSLRIQIKRFSIFGESSKLADATVQVRVDPARSFKVA